MTWDLLCIEYFDQGRAAARAVAIIVTALDRGRSAYGMEFMVSPSLLLTNDHVLGSPDAAASMAEITCETPYEELTKGSGFLIGPHLVEGEYYNARFTHFVQSF